MKELRDYIRQCLVKGRVIEEVQAPKYLVLRELEGKLSFEEPSGIIVGTLFGFPFRDSEVIAVISK